MKKLLLGLLFLSSYAWASGGANNPNYTNASPLPVAVISGGTGGSSFGSNYGTTGSSGTPVAYFGPNGQLMAPSVDSSSHTLVVVSSIQVGGTNISTNNPVPTHDTGTVSVAIVSGGGTGGTASTFGATFPTAGTAIGFTNAAGSMQAGRVDISSSIYTNLEEWNGTTLTASNPLPVTVKNTVPVTISGIVTTTFKNIGQPVTSTFTVISTTYTLTVISTGTSSDNDVAASADRIPVLPGIYHKPYLDGTIATIGNNAALPILTDGAMQVWTGPDISTGGYTGSIAPFSIIDSTQDFTGLCGNAHTMVWILGLRMSCTQTTAGIIPVSISRRSTGYNGSWSTITVMLQDTNYTAAASSAIVMGSQGLTNGTFAGSVDNEQMGCMASGTAAPNDIYISPSEWKLKPIILRGTSQCIGVNTGGTTVTGGQFTATWDWMETATISP